MNATTTMQRQLPLWTLAGPLSVLLTLSLIILRGNTYHFDFPIVATLGLLICWQWRMLGLYASLLMLTASLTYHLNHDSLMWQLGIHLSVALSFVLTALTSMELDVEPAEEPVIEAAPTRNYEGEILDLQKTLDHTSDELKASQATFHDLTTKLRETQLHLEMTQQKLAEADSKVSDLLPLQDIIYSQKTHIQSVENELEKAKTEYLPKYVFDGLQQQKDSLETMIQFYQENEEKAIREKDLYEVSMAQLQLEVSALNEKVNDSAQLRASDQAQIEKYKVQIDGLIVDLENKKEEEAIVDYTSPESRALRRAEGMHAQLREQFENKTAELQKTRMELFHKNEELSVLQIQWLEAQTFDSNGFNSAFEKHIICLEKELEDSQKEIGQLEQIISEMVKS